MYSAEEDEEFNEILELLKREAYEQDAIVLLAPYCLGCFETYPDIFFNVFENRFNTRVIEIVNEAMRNQECSSVNIMALICNNCHTKDISLGVLKNNYILSGMDEIMERLEELN